MMSRSGASISLEEFRKLLKEEEFIDYFNKFTCLPAFSQLVVYSKKRRKYIFHPPLPVTRYSLNYSGLVEWLWRKRFNFFLRSRFYGEFRLCQTLLHHSLLRKCGHALRKSEERAVYDSLKWLQRKCLGSVSAMRKFRKFLQTTEDGAKLYQFWLDSERLYFHLKRGSGAAMDIFNRIKGKYFVRSGESRIPQHLLDTAWDSLPMSHRTPESAGEAKTYDATFTICLQRLCASRLKRYWMPRFLMKQKPKVVADDEKALLSLAQKYLHGAITIALDYEPSVESEDEFENKQVHDLDGLTSDAAQESDYDEFAMQSEASDGEQGPSHSKMDSDEKGKVKEEPWQKTTPGRKGVSFSEHPPPGVSTSDDEKDVKVEDDEHKSGYFSENSSSEDEEYKKRMERRKARSRERRSKRFVSGSLKLGDFEKSKSREGEEDENSSESEEQDQESAVSKEKDVKKRSKDSSGGSDSAESWEGVHEDYRKKKGEKVFRYADRHRKRSIHKRRLKFEELLMKESYRRPSLPTEKVKLFAKGKKSIDKQQILMDDDEKEFIESKKIDELKSRSPGGLGANLENMGGGKALLKAALKLPSAIGQFGAATSRLSLHETDDQKLPDLFNRSPSMWDLSLSEISERLKTRNSDLSSLGSRSTSSKMSLINKIGRLRRPSGLYRSPSSESTGSAANVMQSNIKKRRNTIKIKPKIKKVTTLSFNLSGDAPAPTEKSTRRVEVPGTDKKALTKPSKQREKWLKRRKSPSIQMVIPVILTREWTMEKEYNYRIRQENKRLILALQADQCASQPFRSFLLTTDNEEMVYYLGFWQDVEITRQDFEFGSMSFTAFMQSIQCIVTQYLLQSSPCRIEAPENLREETIIHCLSPDIHEMPWQMRKLQMEVLEDLKYAHEAFHSQEIQSFLNAAAFRREELRFYPENRANLVSPLFKDPPSNEKANREGELSPEMSARMKRSLRLVIEINLPDGREISYGDNESSEDSDDDGYLSTSILPKFIREPQVNMKELASRSVKQYPDPNNPLGIKSTVKIPFDRRMHSATIYKPIKRGGQFLKRPMVRPKSFNDVLKDSVQYEFFKRYLKAYRADMPLVFWSAVESLRTSDKLKSRQLKARHIIKKFFHNPKIPATKMLQSNADIIKEIPYLDIVTTSMLFSAQQIIARALEERWFRRYADTFDETILSDVDITDKSYTTRALISRSSRLKRVWLVFNDFIKRAAAFLRTMKRPHMFKMFRNFLEREVDADDSGNQNAYSVGEFVANRSESTILPFFSYRGENENDGMKQRVINGQLVTFNFLPNDLDFWRDIECYKTMAACSSALDRIGADSDEEIQLLKSKAGLIVSCYLESDIAPRIRVNLPMEVADITVESLQNGLVDQALFHEAIIYVFPLLLNFWKKFCAEHYRYVPTLSKKHKMIYGLKMTPVIAENLRNEKLGIMPKPETTDVKKKIKKKTKRIDTADLPNYLEMDGSKFSKKRGSPFGGDEMGPRLTFSIRRGITIIEPIRRRKFQMLKGGGSPDVRVVLDSSATSNAIQSRQSKKPINDAPKPQRSRAGRNTLLDASILQQFADKASALSFSE